MSDARSVGTDVTGADLSRFRDLFEGARTLVLADGVDGARVVPAGLAAEGRLEGLDVVVGWVPDHQDWVAELRGARAVMGGYGLREAIRAGRVTYIPVHISTVPRFVASLPRPLVTVVGGRPSEGGWCFGRSVGWAHAAATVSDAVVVEADERAPCVEAPRIPGPVAGAVEAEPPPATIRRVPDALDRAIAEKVVSLLPPEPTLQYGPGPLLDAVVEAIDRPVRILSGLVTDAVLSLERDGRLRDRVVAGYLWGSDELWAMGAEGRIRLAPVSETHDIGRLSAEPGFVAINTALEVGLDGSVNVERIGDDLVGGVGGHADFCRAACRCPGGLSVIVLRSSHRGRSTIVEKVTTVSTPRTDVDVVVTEHGVADLRGRSDRERAEALVAVARPDHRADLAAAAAQRG